MIAFLTLELRIEAAHSLKDKRQVTRSLKDRLRSSFNVSVAELDPSPLWNQATMGVQGLVFEKLSGRPNKKRGAHPPPDPQKSRRGIWVFVRRVPLPPTLT